MPYAPKDATPATARVNRDAAGLYDLADRQDFGDAARGLIAPWPGQVVSSADGHVIFDPDWFGFFADPGNTGAKGLRADAYEQMGCQPEGPQGRGIFLTAAKELREGVQPAPFTTASPDTIMGMPVEILSDFAAVHVIGGRAADADLRIDFTFTDLGQTWTVWVRRGVLNARPGASPDTLLTVSGPKAVLVGVILQPGAAGQLAQAGKIRLDGDQSALAAFAGLLDEFALDFDIVTP